MRLALLANPDDTHTKRWLNFLVPRGHEILLIADPHTADRPAGVRVEVPRWGFASKVLAFKLTPRPHGNALWKSLHYRPILRRFAPEVVHGFEAHYNGLATARAAPYPRVLTPWGKDVHSDARESWLAGWMVGRALRGVDRVTTNDETLAQYLAEHFRVPAAKVKAFSWGIDLGVFRKGYEAEASQWRRRLEIPEGAEVIFNPRRFDAYRGGETMIDAMPAVLKERPGAVFVALAMPADREFVQAMKEKARRAGVESALRIIDDRLSPEQMAALYNLGAVYLSIPKGDLLAMSVLEGMACGSFPVLSRQAGYMKHARDRENCLIAPPENAPATAKAIVTALGDADLRRRAAETNIRRMREQEDASVNMPKMEEVYAEAIEEFRRRRG